MAGEVFPYFVPDPRAVRFTRWKLVDTNGWAELPDRLPDWDSNTDLAIWREVVVDLNRVLADTRLPVYAGLTLTVSWTSSTTGMRDAIKPVEIVDNRPITLQAVLPGERIAGQVDVKTTLTVARPVLTTEPGMVRVPGSVLLEDHQSVTLGTDAPPFPVHEIDFARTRLDPDASWHLETSTDLSAPFLGTFLLLLNRRDGELVDAVSGDHRDRRKQLLVEDLELGVAALLLELATELRAEIQEQSWPSGTVGCVLGQILAGSPRVMSLRPSSGPDDLSETRTQFQGAARAAGRGRQFA